MSQRVDWVKFHNAFYEDERIAGLSHGAFRAYVEGVCLADRLNTDGKLTARKIRALTKPRFCQELISAGLWLRTDDGVEIANYLEWQRSASDKEETRRKRSEAGKLGGIASREARREANAEGDASPPAEANGQAKLRQRERESKSQSSTGRLVFNGSSNGLPNEKAHELLKLLEAIGNDADAGTEGVLASLAHDLPLAAIAKVRESLQNQKPRNRAQYVVASLKGEIQEREEDIPF